MSWKPQPVKFASSAYTWPAFAAASTTFCTITVGATLEIDTNEADRLEQSESIAAKARQIKEPHLLVGDFNTPPQSAIFPKVWPAYTDAFATAGTGWGYTFYGSKTMVRIDHILASKGWYCSRCWVGPEVGSPHRPVIADLIWPASEGAKVAGLTPGHSISPHCHGTACAAPQPGGQPRCSAPLPASA